MNHNNEIDTIKAQVQHQEQLIHLKEREIEQHRNNLEQLDLLLKEVQEKKDLITTPTDPPLPLPPPPVISKPTPFDIYYKELPSQPHHEPSPEYIRLTGSDWKSSIKYGGGLHGEQQLQTVSVSHVSQTIKDDGSFVDFDRFDNFYNCNMGADLDFDSKQGTYMAPSYALYLISVVVLEGDTKHIFVEFSHPQAQGGDTVLWKIPEQPHDVAQYFHNQDPTDLAAATIPREEMFVYNIVKNASTDITSLQQYKIITKRNNKKERLKNWRSKKRQANGGNTGFFHFPEHSQIRLAREIQEEILEPVPEDAFLPGPADMFARTFKLLPGTLVRVVYQETTTSTLMSKTGLEKKKILFTVARLRFLFSPPDWIIRKLKKGICVIDNKNVYSCYRCGKSFETSTQLFSHIRSRNYFGIPLHQKPKGEFISPHNGKRFLKQEHLNQHLKDYKPYKCQLCLRTFFSSDRLEQHSKDSHFNPPHNSYHYKIKIGKCPWRNPKFCCVKEKCGAIFMEAKFLIQHHKDKPHFKCFTCDRKFMKKSSLFLHIKMKHDINDYNNMLRRHLQRILQNKTRTRLIKNKKSHQEKIQKLEQKIANLGGSFEESPEEIVTEGHLMTKSRNSHSVINIVPPRQIWDPIQSIRTRYIPDARCGPHFSFLDPFLLPKHYPQASKLLRDELSTFPPFTVHLNDFDCFIHSRTISLFLLPSTDPPDAFEQLLCRCLKVFPQCNDLVLRSQTGTYHPHMTLARFDSQDELKREMEQLKNGWKSLSFVVKELYFLSRQGGEPFEVAVVVPLGTALPLHDGTSMVPNFGRGSRGSFENLDPGLSTLSSSCVVCCLPQPGITSSVLKGSFYGFSLIDAEVFQNPDGSLRDSGVVEFSSPEVAREACENWNGEFRSPERNSVITGSSYLIHLPNAVFPCRGPGDCCSFLAVTKGLWRKWSE